MIKFIATYVQTSDTADGRPHILGVYDTENEAAFEVNYDMINWYKATNLGLCVGCSKCSIDYGKMIAIVGDTECIWNIEEIEI